MSEGWADFAEDLKTLANKAYPSLQLEARERLAVNTYLQQLSQPQVAFSVKQRRPATLDDAVTATLEMESYMLLLGRTEPVSTIQPTDIEPVSAGATNEPVPVSAISSTEKLTSIVERLSEQVETLQREVRQSRNAPVNTRRDSRPRGDGDIRREQGQRTGRQPYAQRRAFDEVCWRCNQRGHIERNCTQSWPYQQGN